MYIIYQVFKEYSASDKILVAEFRKRNEAYHLEKALLNSSTRGFVPVVYCAFKDLSIEDEKRLNAALEWTYEKVKEGTQLETEGTGTGLKEG